MNSVSVRGLLVRGMLAGLLAGCLALLVAYFLGEPHLDAAIAYEEGGAEAPGHSHGSGGHDGAAAHSHDHAEEPLVSRTVQATAGLAAGIVVFGVCAGGIASLAVAYALGRVGRFGPRATSLLVAGGALLAVYVVPFLKYPANPPGVGDPATIDRRTQLYFLLLALGVLLALLAVVAGRRLAPRLGSWNATLAAGGAFVAAIGLAYALMPSLNEVPADFPAQLLWQFRLSALAVHVTLWASFGVVFGLLAERQLLPGSAPARSVAAVS
ncbi:CbtA family protein [Streptomyces polyrhachis]|uniref:CbtA family protein n=1 Tax=Streptomyces polyrhachis TaxID=1282885 RepID=A0ABW2GGG5_9ACTN